MSSLFEQGFVITLASPAVQHPLSLPTSGILSPSPDIRPSIFQRHSGPFYFGAPLPFDQDFLPQQHTRALGLTLYRHFFSFRVSIISF
jgi:hypothetical protein